MSRARRSLLAPGAAAPTTSAARVGSVEFFRGIINTKRAGAWRSVGLLVVLMLAAQGGLLAYSAYVHSPTVLEPAQLVAGIGVWKFGRFDLFNVNPPLVRMVAALPILASGAVVDDALFELGTRRRSAATIGNEFIHANGGHSSFWYFTLARWVCIPLILCGGLACFAWASELYGLSAGLFALTLWSVDPNVLGHGSLITNDVPAAAIGTVAGYFFWRWLRCATWRRAALAGVGLGLAQLAKMTWIILFAVWPFVWACSLYREKRRAGQDFDPPPIRRQSAQLAMCLALGIYVLNLFYGLDGTCTRLSDFQFVSKALGGPAVPTRGGNRFSGGWLGAIPVPLPKQYLAGLDAQRKDFEAFRDPSYLRGEWRQGGWLHYYAYGALVKSPHGTQLLIALAALASVFALFRHGARTRGESRDLLALLTPAFVVFVMASSQTAFSHHVRYIWPCIGSLSVFAASNVVSRIGVLRRVSICCLALTAMSSASVFPHGVSYFNELSGGPTAAGEHLIHSNVDWGQDLRYLKAWSDIHHDARPLFVACCAPMSMSDAGLPYPAPPHSEGGGCAAPELSPGWYAVSVNYLVLKQANPEGFSGHSRGPGGAQRRPAGAGATRGFEFSSVIEDCFLG